jgi:poly-gamma-glutamate capsule biosynthesis protein CapA/YwtB (metallophosphatase superfamily)
MRTGQLSVHARRSTSVTHARRLLVAALAAGLLVGCSVLEPNGTEQQPVTQHTAAQPGAGVTRGPTAPSSPASIRRAERISIAVTGDVLLHERLWVTARRDGHGSLDFAPAMAPVKPLVSGADLAVCHLETPLAPAGGPYRGYPLFSAPPQVAMALRHTGYDACTTASNHSFDGGAAGVDRTLDVLDAAGLRHAGTARSRAEAVAPVLIDVRGVKIGLLSYTYGFNALAYPGGQTWRANRIDQKAIRAAARAARVAGAQIVVLVCQWGSEYVHEPNQQQRTLAPRLAADPGIDLVVGHHAHVVQPLDKIGDTWVAYGLGNLIAAHRRPADPTSEGLLVRFTFSHQSGGRWLATKAQYAELLVTDALPVRVLDVRRELTRPGSGPASQARLRLAQRRIDQIVNSHGAARDGATPIG